MITYQDFLEVSQEDDQVVEFVRRVIEDHKSSDAFKSAYIADQYFRNQNVTIMEYQRLLYTMTGQAVPDNYASNYKLRDNYFNYFVTQENQYLLGNGTTWGKSGTKEKLGTKTKDFDSQLMELGEKALVQGASYGFFNLDHLDVFGLLEFAPILDEENGALMAGVRFWQLTDSKPLRATFYEVDGYRNIIWKPGEKGEITEKRAYKYNIGVSEADGEVIYDGENYPSFPIIPLYANTFKQSEFEGKREKIDCYDLILSGFANTIDEGSFMYWAIQNAGGMDDVDLVKFVEHMKTIHAAVVEDANARAEAHTIEAPYNGRNELLQKLRSDLFDAFMALDVKEIAAGATTATQIKAAYEPLNSKVDKYEKQVRDFVYAVLELVGIDDEPTWSRSVIVNETEQIQAVMMAAQYLQDDYITRKLLTIMGDGDLADDMLKQLSEDEVERFADIPEDTPPETEQAAQQELEQEQFEQPDE